MYFDAIFCIFYKGQKRKLDNKDELAIPMKKFVPEKSTKTETRNDFLIVKLSYEENENPCNILMRSAGFSKTSIMWEYEKTSEGHRCLVKLQNSVIHSATGDFAYLQRLIFNLEDFFGRKKSDRN